MSSKRNVPASEVRTWARENIALIPEVGHACLNPTARGRLHPAVRAAYDKANKGKTYTPKAAESPTFTVPVVVLDKAGRKTTIKRTITNIEARDALGQVTREGDKVTLRKGKMPMGLLSEALSAAYANEVADQFA